MGDGYCEPTTDMPTKKMDHYLDIMQNKVAFCLHVTLPPKYQVLVKVVTKMIGFLFKE